MTIQNLLAAFRFLAVATLVALTAGEVSAQGASSGVIVGPGFAGANAGAIGRWTHTDTASRVGRNGSMARGLGVGVGPGQSHVDFVSVQGLR